MSFIIEHLWLFVATHPDGDEGVIAENVGGQWLPFVAADERRLEQIKARVQALPLQPNVTVKLVRFDTRVDVETVRS